jgi:hypothetical protein
VDDGALAQAQHKIGELADGQRQRGAAGIG